MQREPTRHQLSSRLTYNARTPSFLLKLQNKVAGRPTDEDEDEDEPQYLDGVDEFGRERRPPIPERPDQDKGGSEGEDDNDEKPTVVVLKEGKHLTEEEAENERRKAKGLPPLAPRSRSKSPPRHDDDSANKPIPDSSKKSTAQSKLSFSSTKATSTKKPPLKRKILHGNDEPSEGGQTPKKTKKKARGLLSFDDTI